MTKRLTEEQKQPKKKPPLRAQPGSHPNSIEKKVLTGDPKTLKLLGMSQRDAKKAYREWQRDMRANYGAMEKWYSAQVRQQGGYGGDYS